jgi:ABC-type lipoprotein release transport system permease subunit
MPRYCEGKRTDYDLPHAVFSSLLFLFLMSSYSSQYTALRYSQLKDASTLQKAGL